MTVLEKIMMALSEHDTDIHIAIEQVHKDTGLSSDLLYSIYYNQENDSDY